MDQIKIENLEVYAAHGVFQEETREGQMFLVDVILNTNLRPAGIADELTLSTHYGEVCQAINVYLREHTFQLIEAAAEHLAEELLMQFPLVDSVVLELKKPHAPIKLPFSNVSVRIERGWKKVYLGIGSNMGDRRKFLEQGISGLKENARIRKVKCSKVIETKPYGGVEQENFYNAAVELQTLLPPGELLSFLHQLEAKAGRKRKVHWGPRTLDLDILFYQDFVSGDPVLTVPHPDMANRAFVLEPLNELCPWYLHPVTGKSVRQMLEELKKQCGSEEESEKGKKTPSGQL